MRTAPAKKNRLAAVFLLRAEGITSSLRQPERQRREQQPVLRQREWPEQQPELQRREPGQQPEPEREQELLPSCRKQPEQQQPSERR